MLPDSGGYYDQSAEVIEAFEIINMEVNKVREAEERRQKAEQRKR